MILQSPFYSLILKLSFEIFMLVRDYSILTFSHLICFSIERFPCKVLQIHQHLMFFLHIKIATRSSKDYGLLNIYVVLAHSDEIVVFLCLLFSHYYIALHPRHGSWISLASFMMGKNHILVPFQHVCLFCLFHFFFNKLAVIVYSPPGSVVLINQSFYYNSRKASISRREDGDH